MILTLPRFFAFTVTVILLSSLLITTTFAAPPSNRPGNSGFAIQKNPNSQSSNSGTPSKGAGRLEGAKLKSCQGRENAIKKRSEKLTQLVVTMQKNFDAIANRVMDYYTTKLIPEGKTVTNYDILVADVQTKKDAVQTALTNAQTNLSGFSCTESDPKANLKAFNQDMKAVKSALKNYRMSVKNLIVGVRSATGEENGQGFLNRNKPSNKPAQNSGKGNINRKNSL